MSARVLPHAAVLEAALLGGLLFQPAALAEVPELEPGDFYDPRHRTVFAAIRNLEAAQIPIDLATLEHALARAEQLDAIGGAPFLAVLSLQPAIVANVVAYATTIRELAHARALMLAAGDLLEQGYEPDLDVAAYLDRAERAVLGVAAAARRHAATGAPIGTIIGARYRQLDRIVQARAAGGTPLTGVTTGIAALDAQLGGYQPGVINLIAARPAMGKSAVALAAVDALTDGAEGGAHVFSLEDAVTAYADRCLARRSGIEVGAIRRGDLDRQQIGVLTQAAAALYRKQARWLVDGEGGLRAIDIIRRVRQHRAALNTRLVVVDYVQLVRRNPRLNENDAIDEIMTEFAAAAKEDGERIAWVVVSQLNRKCEERIDKRPVISDLRGSGSLEERAKVVVGLYRGAYYDPDPRVDIDYDCTCAAHVAGTDRCSHRPSRETFAHTLQLLILKHNQGATGRLFAPCHLPTMEIA